MNLSNHSNQLSRRVFLKKIGPIGIVFSIASSSLLSQKPGPNGKIQLGVIGYGNRAHAILPHFMRFNEIRVVAIADCQKERRQLGKQLVDNFYGTKECREIADFRELINDKNIDAVLIATGNRWHGLASIWAARAGKHIYCEKPITLTITEGRELVTAVLSHGVIYQAGHQRRNVDSYRFMAEIVRQGFIGHPRKCIMQVWEGPVIPYQEPSPVPEGFDYDMWLGQSPWRPFCWAHVKNWQYFWDMAEGVLTDMGCHYTDLMQWTLNKDDTGPVEFEGWALFPKNAYSETPVRAEVRCRYLDGFIGVLQQRGSFSERFIRFEGDEGWIQVDDETNRIHAMPQSLLKLRVIEKGTWADTGNHIRDWLNAIFTRKQPAAHVEAAHRAISICQVANICLRLGRPLKWNPLTESFPEDEDANRMRSRTRRAPWTA